MVNELVAVMAPALLLIVPPSKTKSFTTSVAGLVKASRPLRSVILAVPWITRLLRTVSEPPLRLTLATVGTVNPPRRPSRNRVFTVAVVLLRLRFPVAALM